MLISAGALSGYEFGPGELNPYDQFQKLRPTAVIDDGVFVFDGHFQIPLASALNHLSRGKRMAENGDLPGALQELQTAARLAPRSARIQAELGNLLIRLSQKDQARPILQRALMLARTIEPDHQQDIAADLQRTLDQK